VLCRDVRNLGKGLANVERCLLLHQKLLPLSPIILDRRRVRDQP